MAVDMDELASAVFGTRSAERSASRDEGATTTVYGRATSDSAGGVVSVALDGVTLADDDGDGAIEVSTTTAVREGDDVIVTLVGPATGRHPIVTGVVGRGDEQQAQMEAETVARESAITQKADEIMASVAESYATKAALNGEVTSRESIVRQTANGVEVAKKVNGVYTGTKAMIDDDSFDIQGQDGTVYSSFGASKVKLGSWGPEAKVGDKSSIELFGGSITGTRGETRDNMSISTMGALRIQAYDTLALSSDIAGISLSSRDGVAIGNGTMLKAVYCGSTVVYVDQNGNAKLFPGSTYGTKEIGRSSLFVSSGDHHVYARNISAWWANDSSGDWWVHTEAANKNIRVNWTLIKW